MSRRESPHRKRAGKARRAAEKADMTQDVRVKKVGPYRLFGKIGSGPTGRVYLGVHRDYGKRSAVKVLRKRFEGDAEPFMKQLRLAVKLDHPNIASAHSVHQSRDKVFIAASYIEGFPLPEFSLGQKQAVTSMIKVAEAVEAAHHAGLAHGNLKPNNLMFNENGDPFVTDFCVPPSMEEPHFLAPEQASGNPKPTKKADIYSLGALLYYMVTQRYPFAGESPSQVLHRIATYEFVPPRKVESNVHPWFEAVIRKAMARDPERRYRTPAEFAVDLRNLEQKKKPMAVAESQGRIRRRVLAVAALLALAGAGVVLWKPWEKKPETPEVVHRPDPEPVSEPVREEKDPTPFLPPPLEPDPKPEPEPDPEPEPKPDPGFPEPLMKSIRARVIDTHPYYLQTYLLPEERARLQDLRKAGRGTEEDLEFLRRRILGEVARAIGEDRDSIQAHLDELSSAARKHQKRVDDARRNQAWLAFVDFCRKNDLHRARDYGLYAHLQVDPGHAETRKELGYEPSPFGFWRKKVAARTTEGGIEFEGRVHTRDQLRALLLERGYVVVNKQWCQKLKWTGPPSKPFFTNAREFQVYKWRVRQVYDPFAKMELQMRLFEPRWTYYGPEPIGERSGECEGTVSIRVEGRLPFAECRVRAPARILEGGGSVKFRVEVGGTRSELYELKKGEKDEMIDISNFVRGSRRFTLSAVLTCPYDGRDNRSARFLPGDRKFEIVADVAMAVPELTRLLGTDKPVSDPALARKMLVEAAGRLITGKQDITEACMRIAGEAALLKYDGPIETPLEFEGLARIIGHPVSFDPDKLPEDQLKKLHRAWNGFALDKKREFAAWFGLWYAREKFRSGD